MPPKKNTPPVIPPWPQNVDCVGQEDPVDHIPIPDGHGFRLQADRRCYHGNTLARIKRMDLDLVSPINHRNFTENDKMRVDNYINYYPKSDVVVIRSRADLENAPRLETGAYDLRRANFVKRGTRPGDTRIYTISLENTDLQGANLQGAQLRYTNLNNANLQGADLRGAKLENIRGANLSGANLEGVTIYEKNSIRNINFSGANLRGVNFSNNNNLDTCNFENANMEGAVLSGSNLQGVDLSGANLTNAKMQNANLSDANLQHSILTGAHLEGAILNQTDLRNAVIDGIFIDEEGLANIIIDEAQRPILIARAQATQIATAERLAQEQAATERMLARHAAQAQELAREQAQAEAQAEAQVQAQQGHAVRDPHNITNVHEAHSIVDSVIVSFLKSKIATMEDGPTLVDEVNKIDTSTFFSKISNYVTSLLASLTPEELSNLPKKPNGYYPPQIKNWGDVWRYLFNKISQSTSANKKAILISLIYAAKQPIKFQSNYILAFLNDSAFAYSIPTNYSNPKFENYISCTKGIMERFSLSLNNAIKSALTDPEMPEDKKEEYKRLQTMLHGGRVDMELAKELLSAWVKEHQNIITENGEFRANKDELINQERQKLIRHLACLLGATEEEMMSNKNAELRDAINYMFSDDNILDNTLGGRRRKTRKHKRKIGRKTTIKKMRKTRTMKRMRRTVTKRKKN